MLLNVLYMLLLFVILIILNINITHFKFKKDYKKIIKRLNRTIYYLEFGQTINSESTENKKDTILKNIVFFNLIIVLLFSYIFFNIISNDIYLENYEPLTVTSFQVRDGENKLTDFNIAVDYYLSENYDKAELIFDKLKDNNPEIILYSALNKMALKHYDDSIVLFDKLIYTNCYVRESQWYSALCYIKIGNKAKAKELLLMLSEEPGIYKEKSKKILKKI